MLLSPMCRSLTTTVLIEVDGNRARRSGQAAPASTSVRIAHASTRRRRMRSCRGTWLSVKQILDGWHLASPEEQAQLLPILQRKATRRAFANIPMPERLNIINRVRKIFGAPEVQLEEQANANGNL